jgi:hypothetical protein
VPVRRARYAAQAAQSAGERLRLARGLAGFVPCPVPTGRPLPRPLTIRTVVRLSTLADLRDLVEKHPSEQYRRKPGWRHVSNEIAKAAQGEKDLLNA